MEIESLFLKDKAIPGITDIRNLSFEYMLATICKREFESEKYHDVKEFNVKNNFSIPKILLYPFFVALSNGHSESLYSLFGEFYALSFGPVSLEIYKTIDSSQSTPETLPYFTFEKKLNIDAHFESLDKILNDIKEREVVVCLPNQPEERILFKNILIRGTSGSLKSLPAAIENGIKAIEEQSNRNFFKADTDILRFHATYFNAFKNKYTEGSVSEIKYNELEEPKRRPFYLEEMTRRQD